MNTYNSDILNGPIERDPSIDAHVAAPLIANGAEDLLDMLGLSA